MVSNHFQTSIYQNKCPGSTNASTKRNAIELITIHHVNILFLPAMNNTGSDLRG